MAQITLHLEVRIEAEGLGVTALQPPPEFLGQARFGKIGDMCRHAGDGEACARHLAIGIIVAAAPERIGHDRLAPDFVKGDILRAVPRGRGDDDAAFDPVGEEGGPGQRLHAAHRPADHRRQPIDAQMVEQHRLRPHHVGDGQHREAHGVRIAQRGVDAGGAGRSHAAADDVGADDEMACRIDRPALAHHAPPPAGLAGDGMVRCDILVAGQRVADQDDVGFVRVHLPIGLIGDVDRGQAGAARQRQRTRKAGLAAQAETCVRGNAGHDIGLRRGKEAVNWRAGWRSACAMPRWRA